MIRPWNDFNDAEKQNNFDLIPKGSIVPVQMSIKPGGYDEYNQGWTGGYATRNPRTGSVYLNCMFVVTDGPYAHRKIWSLIGLRSPKGPKWGEMGRSFVRGILLSARGISEKDRSPQAIQALQINGIEDLDGIQFLAKVGVEKNQDKNDEERNTIQFAIIPDHAAYPREAEATQETAWPLPPIAVANDWHAEQEENAYAASTQKPTEIRRPPWV